MFEPRSIALIGASEKSFWTKLITENYVTLGFAGKLFAVNRSGKETFGIPGYSSCQEIGEPVDIGIIFVPQDAVVSALEDAAAAGIEHFVILSSGYAEIGAEGEAKQAALVARAEALGVTIWGPNSLGFNNVGNRVPVSSISAVLPILPPSIAIVTQSGASAIELNEYAHSQNIGTSFIAATGNEAMVSFADLVDYLVDHESTKVVAVFTESVRDPAGFIRAAERARTKRKPIIFLKIGRSQLADAVAMAHTGSLVGDDKVFDAVCERLGVIRVYSPEELISVAGLMAATGPLLAPGLAFVSVSGGACTLAADGAEAAGVVMPPHPPELLDRLRAALPDFASTLNPLDVTGALLGDPTLLERVIPIIAESPDVGIIAINLIVPTMPGQGFPPALTPVGRAAAKLDKPVILATTTNKALNDLTREVIAEHGLPHVVTGISAMLNAVAKANWWSQRIKTAGTPMLLTEPALQLAGIAPASLDTERAVLDYLAQAGVPVIPGRVATTEAEAVAAAAALGDRLVFKIASPDIAHKTEVGGVRLNVAPADAAGAFQAILAGVKQARPEAAIAGVIVSPMRADGLELLVGVTRDPLWGLLIAVGLGGVLVEMLDDVVIAPLPVTQADATAMLRKLRGAKLFAGYRGGAAVDVEAVAQAVIKIGDAAAALGPALQSLEINPLLVSADRVEALDALAIFQTGAAG